MSTLVPRGVQVRRPASPLGWVRGWGGLVLTATALVLILALRPALADDEGGGGSSGAVTQATWMRVYTTGRQPLSSRDPGVKPAPAGHLVGTSIAPAPNGSLLVAGFVGDPLNPRADLAVGHLDRCGTVLWSNDYVTAPPAVPSQEDAAHARVGLWARLVALPAGWSADYAVAWRDCLMLLDAAGAPVRAWRYPGVRRFSGLVAHDSGDLLITGCATPAAAAKSLPTLIVARITPRGEEAPRTVWARRLGNLGHGAIRPLRQRVDAVVVPDGSLWVGTSPATLLHIAADGGLIGAWTFVPEPFLCHGEHGKGKDFLYRALAASEDGGLFVAGTYTLRSRKTTTVAQEALVACLNAGGGSPAVGWTALLSENTGYGMITEIHDLAATGGSLYLTGCTSHWGQDEGDYNWGAAAARLDTSGEVAWVRSLGRKRHSEARSEYSDDFGHALLPQDDGGVALCGSTDSFSHPMPEAVRYHQAATGHPELLVALVGAEGGVANVGFGRSPNLALAPTLGDRVRQVDVLIPPLRLESASPTWDEEATLDAETTVVTTRDGNWHERLLDGQRRPGDGPPVAVFGIVDAGEDRIWEPMVRFDPSRSSDPEGRPLALHHWMFGDGRSSDERSPGCRFPDGGAFDVTLAVTDAQGFEGACTRRILVGKTLGGAAYPATFDSGKTTAYTVEVVMGNLEKAGTDAEVRLSLIGPPDDAGDRHGTGDLVLDAAHGISGSPDLFEKGGLDTFRLADKPALSEVDYAVLRHDNSGTSPGWYVVGLRVTQEKSGKPWYFRAETWLERNPGAKRASHVRLVPVPIPPLAILFDESPRSHGLTAVSDNIFILPPGAATVRVTSLDRETSVSVYSANGILIGTRPGVGSGKAVFPYLQDAEWGVTVDAGAIEAAGPTPLSVRLGNDDERRTTVWLFPSHWVGYEREAKAVAMLAPLRGETKRIFGRQEGSVYATIAEQLRAANTSHSAYDAAMSVVVNYGREAIGIFGAVPDELLRGEITVAGGAFVVDRLANALQVAGNTIANQTVGEFSSAITALLSAATWGLKLPDVVHSGTGLAGKSQLIGWIPDENRVFRQVGLIWDTLRPDVETIVGTGGPEGAAAGNDPAAARTALDRIRRLCIGDHPDSKVLTDHELSYADFGGMTTHVSIPWHLSLLLLWEWRQVNDYARGVSYAHWYPSGRIDLTTSETKRREAKAIAADYAVIVEDLTGVSSILIDVALIPVAR